MDLFGDKFIRISTKVLLDNQRLMNETPTNTEEVAQFKRITIPLVRKIYPPLNFTEFNFTGYSKFPECSINWQKEGF